MKGITREIRHIPLILASHLFLSLSLQLYLESISDMLLGVEEHLQNTK